MHRHRRRPATPDDFAFCWNLHRATMRDSVAATWGVWDEDAQRARFEARFLPAITEIVETDDGAAIGAITVDRSASPVHLLTLEIEPAHQRRGHGAALVRAIVREAAPRPVWLQVLKANPARALYERLGFRMYAETATHWQMLRACPAR